MNFKWLFSLLMPGIKQQYVKRDKATGEINDRLATTKDIRLNILGFTLLILVAFLMFGLIYLMPSSGPSQGLSEISYQFISNHLVPFILSICFLIVAAGVIEIVNNYEIETTLSKRLPIISNGI